jgi:hypothetical protein
MDPWMENTAKYEKLLNINRGTRRKTARTNSSA